MATTRLIPLHVGNGRTIEAAISQSTGYAMNPDKTDDGELVTAYGCDARTVDAEFVLSKRQYLAITGQEQPKDKDVFAYHTRQSFRPGEITPQAANQIGYESALSFTKGQHAFIVATHTDRSHIHNHVIINSTKLDCTGKFRNFWNSAFALRRVSDGFCVEYGYSIVEHPKPKGKHYGEWLGDNKKPSFQQQIKQAIDVALEQKPATFDDFLHLLEAAGIEVIRTGKHLKFRVPGQTKPTRCNTLRGNYTEQAIQERISGRKSVPPVQAVEKPNLLIDIENNIKARNSPGYERWAKTHNLKQMAKTLIYLQEKGLTEYPALEKQAADAVDRHADLSRQIKEMDTRLSEIAALQKQIGNYGRTRDVYAAYRKSGYSKKYRMEHESEILLHQAAKDHFNALALPKLPTIKALKTEYATLLAEKKKLYSAFRQARDDMREILTVKQNADQLLQHRHDELEHQNQQTKS